MLFLLLFSAAHADCEEPAALSNVLANVSSAEHAYGRLDTAQFQTFAGRVMADVACVEEPISAEDALAIHRLAGLKARADGQQGHARGAFAAARFLNPGATLPEHVVPDDRSFPEWADFEAIPLDTRATAPVPAPREGAIRLDSRDTLERPTAWPVIFQYRDSSGAVQTTRYLWAEDPLPAYPQVQPPRRVGPLALGGASAAMLATGVGLNVHGWLRNYAWDCNDEGCTDEQDRAIQVEQRYIAAPLMIAGGAGLAGAGAWLWLGQDEAAAGMTAHW